MKRLLNLAKLLLTPPKTEALGLFIYIWMLILGTSYAVYELFFRY